MPREPISKLLETPLLGMWQVAGSDAEHPGVLYLEGSGLRLKLFLDRVERAGRDYVNPTMDAISPPRQPFCVGRTQGAGVVTLLHCAMLKRQGMDDLHSDTSRVELTLQPMQAWIGSEPLDGEGAVYNELSFEAPGLHNVLSTAHVRQEFLGKDGRSDGSLQAQLAELTGASSAYLVFDTDAPRASVEHDGQQYEVIFSTVTENCQSSTAGVDIRSKDNVLIRRRLSMVDDLAAVQFKIEQFLSVLCVGRFTAQEISVRRTYMEPGVRLLWHLGREQNVEPAKRMPHDVLVSLGQHPDLVGPILQRWFRASEQRQLARWLVYDSLGKRAFSTSRFLGLAQAWEIIGREVNRQPTHDRELFARACDEAGAVLRRHLGEVTGERLRGMLRSNNRPSFRTLVEECLAQTPQPAVARVCEDPARFARAVADVRNTLTHLQSGRRLTIDQASRLSLYLTYKLTVLFCVLEAGLLGLPLENLATMLANNDMARAAARPLPDVA